MRRRLVLRHRTRPPLALALANTTLAALAACGRSSSPGFARLLRPEGDGTAGGRVVGGVGGGVEHVEHHRHAPQVPQELPSQPAALVRALDEPGKVGENLRSERADAPLRERRGTSREWPGVWLGSGSG